jgi:hypothetical protein
MNDTTRRYPRTLEEAFGPYQRGPVHEQDTPPMDPADKLMITVCTLISAAMLVMMLAGWLPGAAA